MADFLPLLENVRFCRIATQIQEAIAESSVIPYAERKRLDQELREWFDNLPPLLKDYQPCSESLIVTRSVMRWRFLNQRLLLHRPSLLDYAIRRIPSAALQEEERASIEKCRLLAQLTIEEIVATPVINQVTGWNGVWLLFQAVCIPLLGCFLTDSTTKDPRASLECCHRQVNLAIDFLTHMQAWSPAATRTLHVVSRILAASKQGLTTQDAERLNAGTTDDSTIEPFDHLTLLPEFQSNYSSSRVPTLPLHISGGHLDAHIHFSLPGDVELSNPPFPDLLAENNLDESMFQTFWDYLHTADDHIMHDLPFSEYEVARLVDLSDGDLDAICNQIGTDDALTEWNSADFEILWDALETGDANLDNAA